MLALEIQEELLERIGRAERLMRQIRKDNKLIKKTLAEGGANRDAARNRFSHCFISLLYSMSAGVRVP